MSIECVDCCCGAGSRSNGGQQRRQAADAAAVVTCVNSDMRQRRRSPAAAGSSSSSKPDGNLLAQVNISGLRAATDNSRQVSRRLIWVFLLIVCFAVMVAQITDRVRHFLSEPVAVQVTVARNKSLVYPAITICNKVRRRYKVQALFLSTFGEGFRLLLLFLDLINITNKDT